MPIRRSLRLKSRKVVTTERNEQAVKKIKLPRKQEVKTKICVKKLLPLDKIVRRSTRIRKKNSFYTTTEEKFSERRDNLINNLKIDQCEVKLEQIDLLIEKLNLEKTELSNVETSNDEAITLSSLEVSPEHDKFSAEAVIHYSTEVSSSVDIEEPGELTENEIAEKQEELSKHVMEMLNQYKIQNVIDFDEINSICDTFKEEKDIDYSWDTEKSPDRYQEKIIKNVFFTNTNCYNFKSCFKDRAALTSAFDRHSGQISNETYPYDINETPEAEKVKRFYRKNISDPDLHSWYQYNVASSRRFSKEDSDDKVSKPFMDRYLVI